MNSSSFLNQRGLLVNHRNPVVRHVQLQLPVRCLLGALLPLVEGEHVVKELHVEVSRLECLLPVRAD